ncbi:MAG: iron ABC transporter permease [Dehalococcoidia bacterium]|nr:iron ABC transporter permease [Dehalococcoidia bacterium]
MATVSRAEGRASGAPKTRPAVQGHRVSARGYTALILGLVAALIAAILIGTALGAVNVPVDTTVKILLHRMVPGLIEQDWTNVQERIIWDFRLPRVLLAVVVGAGLAVVGAVLQALIRNPLADPYLLGVSSGATLGAVVTFLYLPALIGGVSLSAGAFAGGMATTLVLFTLAKDGDRFAPMRLILAGVALAYLLQAATSYLILRTPEFRAAETLLFWLLGSLGGARWENLALPWGVLVVGVGYLLLQARALNALLAGDETAASLGVNVSRFRMQMFLLTSLLIAVMVANSGAIAFVGLIIPHMVRLVIGAEHRRLLPAAALTGAIFLVLVDLVARTVEQPRELPLSVVTALCGVPFFLWLLRRQRSSQRMSVS